MAEPSSSSYPSLVVSFRGQKVEMLLEPGLSVEHVKERIVSEVAAGTSLGLAPSDVKLLYKGKILGTTRSEDDRNQDMYVLLTSNTAQQNKNKKPGTVYRLLATGVSSTEATVQEEQFQVGLVKNARRIRDDLTTEGQAEIVRRKQLGRTMMRKHQGRSSSVSEYGFGRIQTLPMLPDQDRARQILTTLAHDPGILACMAKHKWKVGSLSELYPEGKVGESQVCVMGLNKNKGQEILLRIRTDDLQGFRKLQSIRKVLYHELAHNVHSDHDGPFFQLMRQIERECTELDWTQGEGLSSNDDDMILEGSTTLYSGGTYRLGGDQTTTDLNNRNVPVRELAARAAMMRLTAEEEEIQQHCGCGKADDANNRSDGH